MARNNKRVVSESSAAKKARATGVSSGERKQLQEMELLLRIARQVDVTAVLRVPDSDVWRLQWTETERSTQPGGATRTMAWEGYLTVRLAPPRTAETVQDNPLGVYVTSLSWTQVGESPSTWFRAPEHGTPGAGDTTLDAGVKP